MPIKFRCNYCRQFLGISRGRAGDVVDCPTCGRSIRVPGLDGIVQPVAAPEINVRDAKLMRALDELANWNAPVQSVAVSQTLEAEAEVEIPQPIAEPIPIEVPLAPEPIAIKPPPVVEAAATAASAEAAAEPAMSVGNALAELQQIAAVEPLSSRAEATSEVFHYSRPQQPSWKMWLAMLLLAVAGFLIGFLTANLRKPSSNPLAEHIVESTVEAPLAAAISGRITYKTADGSSLPDRNARIIVLPREREGTAKLSAAGFRAADHPADVKLATAAVKSLGGDFTLTDDGGQFSIQLANPGTFQIVVISNYADRGKHDDPDPELIRLLTPYFDQPLQVIGRTKTHFGQVRYKGTGTEAWDHSF
jgi:hypothetical protein